MVDHQDQGYLMIGNLLKCLVIDVAVQMSRDFHQTDWSLRAIIGSLIPNLFLTMQGTVNITKKEVEETLKF